ncbi:MAG TPA: tRNA (5-methylaminomethyl-2-thiouridine)(34)-methyltransferase MnmD [Puia sp.]|jgi:tRNA U34 5-methylaminomethyl-2-thiouridine-forming methyltransferase MnmC|nr:tRNA (5-methylaminomethyl-2-thiouridine)(34)-methyltransferase MnmD [Puia sp.]
MKREIIITEDGSHSIAIDQTNITYHSRYGAIRESKHVYIESGLKRLLNQKSCVNIFEMGFGTGLNSLLTLISADENKQKIYYETIDEHFLEDQLFEKLNYCERLERPDLRSTFIELHNCESEKEILINSFFSFKKSQVPLQNYIFNKLSDIIFYDAFAPRAQPELWTEEIFTKLFAALNPNGMLVTYCSKGSVQRAMQAAGFVVEKLPGPPHKREILRAIKK